MQSEHHPVPFLEIERLVFSIVWVLPVHRCERKCFCCHVPVLLSKGLEVCFGHLRQGTQGVARIAALYLLKGETPVAALFAVFKENFT